MRVQILGIFIQSVLCLALPGCATFSSLIKSDPESPSSATAGWAADRLFHLTCETGKGAKQVEGTVWLKTQSKEVHGQFNASVLARAPDELQLEVSDFLGGTVAFLSVRQGRYEMTKGSAKSLSASGFDSWGGIPLRWATDLFLGNLPCPSSGDRLNLIKEEANQLTLEVPDGPLGGQRFSFKYRKIEKEGSKKETQPWPESLHWERLTEPKTAVNFTFDKPDRTTFSPLQWEASSSEGAIKVRWKDRRRLPLPTVPSY